MSDDDLRESWQQVVASPAFSELVTEVETSDEFVDLVDEIAADSTDSLQDLDVEQIFRIWGISFVTGSTIVAALAFGQLLAALVVLAALSQISGVTISSLLQGDE